MTQTILTVWKARRLRIREGLRALSDGKGFLYLVSFISCMGLAQDEGEGSVGPGEFEVSGSVCVGL
jgi:hypothetical protein